MKFDTSADLDAELERLGFRRHEPGSGWVSADSDVDRSVHVGMHALVISSRLRNCEVKGRARVIGCDLEHSNVGGEHVLIGCRGRRVVNANQGHAVFLGHTTPTRPELRPAMPGDDAAAILEYLAKIGEHARSKP